MSHYTQIETQLLSEKYLLKALADLGFKQVECHPKPVKLEGYEGSFRDDLAEVVIRKRFLQSMSNDIGFLKSADGKFTAIISDFDRKLYDELWLAELTRRYSYHVARDVLEEKGFSLVEEENQNREIRLTLRRMT